MDNQGWWASGGSFLGGLLAALGGHKLWGTPRAEGLDSDRLSDLDVKCEQVKLRFDALVIRETARQLEVDSLRNQLEQIRTWQAAFTLTQARQHHDNSLRLEHISEIVDRLAEQRS